jgi:hypothetical protein
MRASKVTTYRDGSPRAATREVTGREVLKYISDHFPDWLCWLTLVAIPVLLVRWVILYGLRYW